MGVNCINNNDFLKKEHFFKVFFVISFFYCVGNIPLFLNSGVFWDDWTLFQMSENGIMQQFRGNGITWLGNFHVLLNKLPNPSLVYNYFTIAAHISTIYVLLKVLSLLNFRNYFYVFIVALSVIVPYFMVRNTMVCLPYTICYLLFFTAFWSLLKWQISRKIIYRVFANILFLVSFITNSLLVFYLFPIVFLFFIEYRNNCFKTWKTCFFSVLKYSDLILSPVLFYVIKITYMNPTGYYSYVSYNKITLNGLLNSPSRLLSSFEESFLGLIIYSIKPLLISRFYVSFFIIILILYVYILKKIKFNLFTNKELRYLIIAGGMLFFLGAFPYVLVNKVPKFEGFETRHQLLLPLGSSLFLGGLILLFVKEQFQNYFIALLFSFFSVATIYGNLQFVNGWFKQESLKVNLETKQLVDNATFVVVDSTTEYNEVQIDYSFYVLNGVVKCIDKKENKLFINYEEYISKKSQLKQLLRDKEMYNMSNYYLSEPHFFLKIKKGSYPLSPLNTVKMIVLKYIKPNKFEKNINNILNIEIHPFSEKEFSVYFKTIN